MRTTINVVTAPAEPVVDVEETSEPTGPEQQDEAPRRVRKAHAAREGENDGR